MQGEFWSFYSTYEELKLNIPGIAYIRYISFYSTYEELKLLISNILFICYYSFYSTYEELKPLSPWISASNPSEFLQYLWGIETNLMTKQERYIRQFLQYLWGIETQ